MIALPEPYTAHPGRREDLADIWRVMVEANFAEAGTAGWSRSEIENWLTGPPIVIDEDVITVRDGTGNIVGVEIFHMRDPYVRPFAIGAVHPDHVGRGLGTRLLAWARQRAVDLVDKAPPDARITFVSYTAAGYEPSDGLMRAAGLRFSRYFIDMVIDFTEPPPPPQVPDGMSIRLFVPAADLVELARVTQESFRDHYGWVATPREKQIELLQHWMKASDHDPSLWWVAEAGGQMVAHNLCEPSNEGDEGVGYVASLGVLREHRGKGLARALLLTAFGEFYRRGKKGAALGVDADSLTGATRLYESVGMHGGPKYASWEVEIRPGIELATTEAPDE